VKKTHLLLLVLTAVLALSSAYSLAAINQVYTIDYEWYSQLNDRFENDHRDVTKDKCLLSSSQLDIGLKIIDGIDSLKAVRKDYLTDLKCISGTDLKDNVYIYCTVNKANSPEFRIKVIDIAQRGNNVEIKVSINTPINVEKLDEESLVTYRPEDVVKIKKSAFSSKGTLFVIYKNQDGRELAKMYYEVR
jgi:hypothetical protein